MSVSEMTASGELAAFNHTNYPTFPSSLQGPDALVLMKF